MNGERLLWDTDLIYMSRQIGKFRTDKFDTYVKQTEILTHATHVNGRERAVYMSCMSQNFRLFHVSNLHDQMQKRIFDHE